MADWAGQSGLESRDKFYQILIVLSKKGFVDVASILRKLA